MAPVENSTWDPAISPPIQLTKSLWRDWKKVQRAGERGVMVAGGLGGTGIRPTAEERWISKASRDRLMNMRLVWPGTWANTFVVRSGHPPVKLKRYGRRSGANR